jgi:hypothetical protein
MENKIKEEDVLLELYIQHVNNLHKSAEVLLSDTSQMKSEKLKIIIECYEKLIYHLLNLD